MINLVISQKWLITCSAPRSKTGSPHALAGSAPSFRLNNVFFAPRAAFQVANQPGYQ
jgi:hypothetical protein